jgi:putative transposase
MIVRRNFKYRIYPTSAQETILLRWEGVLRFLWNLCNEQRLMGLARNRGQYSFGKDQRIFMKDICKDKNLSQNKQMTDLLEEYPWIAEVQSNARQQILADLDKSWQRVFKKLSRKVYWKNKSDHLRIYAPTATVAFDISGDRKTGKLVLDGPKYRPLGELKIVLDRPLQGKVSSWSLKKELNEWYAIAASELDLPIPIKNPNVVGIDRGIAVAIVDSDGRMVANPRFYQSNKKQLTRAQREAARKVRGSKNQKKAYTRVAKIQRKIARQRENFIGTQSLYYAQNYGTVIVENLHIKNMSASAKGTTENPGSKVKQKSGLNREILDVGWGKFADATKYKLEERGGELRKSETPYSSQECSNCHNIDPNNRLTQSEFCCTKCGHKENADINAAKVIKQRGVNIGLIKPKTIKKKLINRRRKPISAVKPTVVQPAEDNSIVVSSKTDIQEPIEAGTKTRESFRHTNEDRPNSINSEIS